MAQKLVPAGGARKTCFIVFSLSKGCNFLARTSGAFTFGHMQSLIQWRVKKPNPSRAELL